MKKSFLVGSMMVAAMVMGSVFMSCDFANGANEYSSNENSYENKEVKYTLNFDSSKISVKNKWYDDEIANGGSVSASDGFVARYTGSSEGKVITWSVNDDEYKVENDTLEMEYTQINSKITGKVINISVNVREIYKAVLDFDESKVVCTGTELDSSKHYKKGDEVEEGKTLNFFPNCRGEFVDSYSVNGVEKKYTSKLSSVIRMTVDGNTIKDGVLNFSFNTHAAKTAEITYDPSKYTIKVIEYGSVNSTSATLSVTKKYSDGTNVTVQEGDKVTIKDIETGHSAHDVCVNGTALSESTDKSLITLNDAGDAICWYDVAGSSKIAVENGIFKITTGTAE